MKKIMILINDIDPNIYVDNIDTSIYDTTVVYQKPVSKAMENKFKICIEKYNVYTWIMVERKENLIPKAKELAIKEKFSTIISFAEDMIIPTEYLKKEVGIKNRYEEIKNITNKFYQREMVSKFYPELSTVAHKIRDKKDAEVIAKNFEFPGMLKPVSMAGSRLAYKVESRKHFLEVIEELAKEEFFHTDFILEEFLLGSEWYGKENVFFDDYVSVESIVSNGKITHLAVSSKPIIAKPFRETGLVVPSTLSQSKQNQLYEAASKVIRALNYKNGPTHIELKLTPSGPKLIEFNPRAGGPVPFLFQTSSEYPIINQIIQSYLGEEVGKFSCFNNSSAFFSFQVGEGEKVILDEINDKVTFEDKNIKEFFIFKHKGEIIDPTIGTSAMIGFAYVVGETPAKCMEIRDKIWDKINVKYSESKGFKNEYKGDS